MSLIESSIVTTGADIGSKLPIRSLGKNEVGYLLSGDNTLCDVVKSDVMRESALITAPLVNNDPLSKLGLKEIPSVSVQDITSQLEDLKHEPSTVHPTPSRSVAVTSSLTDLSLKWADLVEVGNDARVKGVQDSLVVARARGFSRSTDATNVDIASSSDGGEKVGGSSGWTSDQEEFNTYVNAFELVDLSYGGYQFTWVNKRVDRAYIATKIDRVLVNESWLDKFPESTASFLPSGISYHSPVVVNISVPKSSFKKPFKYFDFWSQHPEFLNTVSNSWDQYIRGVPMFRVYQKLRQLNASLKILNKKDFSDISIRVQASNASLDLVQFKLDRDPVNLEATFVNAFTDLFGKPFSDEYHGYERINSLVKNRVSSCQSEMLSSEVTDKEIYDIFWSLKSNKVPGPDGYSASFFKKSWEVVGKEVTEAIRSFFRSGELLQELNSTTIALIPKIPNAKKVGDFRPISCCNTVYKCISKIIANRIKVVLPDLVDPVQSAFVQGRRISDNIFLSQELMRGYHKNSSTPKCTMKVDIMKAYDNVRWDFVLDVLRAMGFPPVFIH
ncbi:uncharacterized protein LOC114299048 [Camellia sinensis]|uniref:uncharacterized protein LOC114299048 n=1 Tax=Camellia sinensis TaxID=4442 RepID=UPI0010362BF3|nr:uncharacterized protein LOC114299048 [Camellia sinensis]